MATAVLTALIGLIPGVEELLVPDSGPLKHRMHSVAFALLWKHRLCIQNQ